MHLLLVAVRVDTVFVQEVHPSADRRWVVDVVRQEVENAGRQVWNGVW